MILEAKSKGGQFSTKELKELLSKVWFCIASLINARYFGTLALLQSELDYELNVLSIPKELGAVGALLLY